MKIVLVTGGFDPLHSGHIEYFKAAKQLGDELHVGLNSDEWLGGNGIYNVYSINNGDNFTELSEALAVQKVRTLRTYYARRLNVNRYFVNETGAVMNVQNEDMSSYV